jgi:hypothetical protein
MTFREVTNTSEILKEKYRRTKVTDILKYQTCVMLLMSTFTDLFTKFCLAFYVNFKDHFMVAPCINNIKLFMYTLMYTNYIKLLNYKSCSNMFRFTLNRHQGATTSALLKLHVCFQCSCR